MIVLVNMQALVHFRAYHASNLAIPIVLKNVRKAMELTVLHLPLIRTFLLYVTRSVEYKLTSMQIKGAFDSPYSGIRIHGI